MVFILLVFAFRSGGTWTALKRLLSLFGDELAVWPFEPMPIMTPTEVIFFWSLTQAVPELIILGKYSYRVLSCQMNDDDTDQGWFNRICRMSVDYVLVDQDKQTVLLAIELDDWTHNTRRRQQQDEKRQSAIEWQVFRYYESMGKPCRTLQLLRRKILAVIG